MANNEFATLGKRIRWFYLEPLEQAVALVLIAATAKQERDNTFPSHAKIYAIKRVREMTYWGLKQSKEFVEDLAKFMEINLLPFDPVAT